jgi:transcriptional regulator with XRE-family HTH domain
MSHMSSPMTLPIASKILTEAAAAIADGDLSRAASLIDRAKAVEPRLNRAQQKLPHTIEDLMPILRRKDAAGPVLAQLRKSFGLSQQAMAAICGVSHGNVAHWEGGRQTMRQEPMERLLKWIGEQGVSNLDGGPSAEALIELRRALGLTQMSMAAKLGIKETTLRRIEFNKQTPSTEILVKYTEIAGDAGLSL